MSTKNLQSAAEDSRALPAHTTSAAKEHGDDGWCLNQEEGFTRAHPLRPQRKQRGLDEIV
jgi:hypothetical protein